MIPEEEKQGSEAANDVVLGLPVDSEAMFSNHRNVYKQQIEDHQRKLLGRISFIRPFLGEDEKIIQVTTGCSPASVIEQLFTGWMVFYLKRSIFVFTNKRILHVPTKANFSYRDSISQIMYADCRSLLIKGRTLVAKYKNGRTDKFVYISRHEKKKIKALLLTRPLEGEQSPALQRTHLCPRCTNLLVEGHYVCPGCSLKFKSSAEARKASLIYPGGGYFYTGHPWLGVGDVIAEIYLTVLATIGLIGVVAGNVGSIFMFGFFGLGLVFQKLVAIYHSNCFIKEYIPNDSRIAPLEQGPEIVEQPDSSREYDAEAVLSVR
jgi:hypothetical protein